MTTTALETIVGQFSDEQMRGNHISLIRSVTNAKTAEDLDRIEDSATRLYRAGAITARSLGLIDGLISDFRINLVIEREANPKKTVTIDQLNDFCRQLMDLREEDMKRNYPSSYAAGRTGRDIGFSIGKKYARIVAEEASCWGFIDMANGDILKADSWSKPAKHPRGNINNGIKDVGPMGPGYLR